MRSTEKIKTSIFNLEPSPKSLFLWRSLKFQVLGFRFQVACRPKTTRSACHLKPGTWNFKPFRTTATFRIVLILLISILGFASCMTTYNTSSIEVELMNPGLITLPKDIDTIAVFKRGFLQSDSITFEFTSGRNYKSLTETSIPYQDISNKCVDNLADYLENENYFIKVINYRDSFNYLFTGTDTQINSPEWHKKLGADAFILLDYFHLWDHQTRNTNSDFIYNLQDAFPEFRRSKKFEFVSAKLIWTIFIKGDSTRYILEQPDDLYYANTVNPEYFGNSDSQRLLLENAAVFLSHSIGAKLLPSMKKVERIYYKSHNIHMIQAEKYLLSGDLLKAAEIYQHETYNKNQNIAAKATYNMALICEMEGKFDAATDWLIHSYSAYKKESEDHQFNCMQYIELLALRKKEIERIEKQIRIE